ncbi:MAG: ABC transporter ATP-binding protein [Desulfobacteraceae bacterium]|jgi:peptide/nickel transport system ATP-binding protein
MLSIENLYVEFISGNNGSANSVVAVEGASLRIESGETVAVIGESGSGKSVMGMAVCRLLPPFALVKGQVFFKEHALLDLPIADIRKIRGEQIAFVPQSAGLSLNPTMLCADQVAEVFIHNCNTTRRKARKFTHELMQKLGLGGRVTDSYPHLLSGGMRQRVLVGIGVAGSPDLLIADEPTKGIDMSRQKDVENLLGQIRDSNPAMAMLLITHDLRLAEALADHVAVMYAGRIVEQTPKKEFFKKPYHPYSRALLNALPERGLTPIPGVPPHPTDRPAGCIFHPRCSFVSASCRQSEPPKNNNNGHLVRCWNYAEV